MSEPAALALTRAAGLEPVEPYPGATALWVCLSLECVRTVSPRLQNVQRLGTGRRYYSGRAVDPAAMTGERAVMESFFALLQKNVLDRRSWATRAELRLAIITWIEHTYNRRPRQRRLGKLTPVEFELAVHNLHLEAA